MTLRQSLYRAARLRGDVAAARRGPAALARRMARREVYGRVNGMTGRLLRRVGLGR